MKITRRQLRKLISEAYRKGVPYRAPIDQSDSHIAKQYPQFTDKLATVDTAQSQAFKQALDPNRPLPDIVLDRETIETVRLADNYNNYDEGVEVSIPRELVDAVVDTYQRVRAEEQQQGTLGYPERATPQAVSIFRYSAQRVFQHIDNYIADNYNGDTVRAYADPYPAKGYRAKEFENAMMAVGAYL
mgnify:FL=1